MLIVLATALCLGLHAKAIAGSLGAIPAADASSAFERMSGLLSQTWIEISRWVREGYRNAPALMLGLAVVVAIPVLALLGLALRRSSRPAPAVVARSPVASEASVAHETEAATGRPNDGMTWPVDAWIEIVGEARARVPVGREMLRIGRDDDNDLVLADDSVHRNHAVVHRTEDAEIVLIDLSDEGGNGVAVNGKRISRARLRNGELLGIGELQLKFLSRRA